MGLPQRAVLAQTAQCSETWAEKSEQCRIVQYSGTLSIHYVGMYCTLHCPSEEVDFVVLTPVSKPWPLMWKWHPAKVIPRQNICSPFLTIIMVLWTMFIWNKFAVIHIISMNSTLFWTNVLTFLTHFSSFWVQKITMSTLSVSLTESYDCLDRKTWFKPSCKINIIDFHHLLQLTKLTKS